MLVSGTIFQMLVVSSLTLPAQEPKTSSFTLGKNDSVYSVTAAETEFEGILTELAENGLTETALKEYRDQLSDLLEHPLALNSATREQLESIPFLTGDQTEALSYYLYRYGPMVDISELLLVEGFNEQTLQRLAPFVYLTDTLPAATGKQPLKKILSIGKQEISLTSGRSVQQKKGYTENEASGDRYTGDPMMCSFRYGFNYKNNIQWGITCQKDAGENWLSKQHLPDYTSFHLLYRGNKMISTLIAGDYTVSLGQGLICGKAFGLGKTLSNPQPEVYGQSLRRHISTAENGYLRGIACQLNLTGYRSSREKHFLRQSQLLVFSSIRQLDANVINGQFASISETGLHRTVQEQSIRNKVRMVSGGLSLSIRSRMLQLGLSGIFWRFNAWLRPEPAPYNLFYQKGNKGGNASVYYRFRWQSASWFGELATDTQGNLASLTGVSVKPSGNMDVSLLYRYYSPCYKAFFGQAFGEGTAVRNEKGCYASVEWRLMPHLRLNAYYDLFVFPWMTYQCDEPSSGNETAIQSVTQLSKQTEFVVRFKQKRTDKNRLAAGCHLPVTAICEKRQFRCQITELAAKWTFQTILDYNTFENEPVKSATAGIALSQTIRFKLAHPALDLSTKISLFDAENYENRIYSYERSLPGSYSMPGFYGQGARLSLCAACSLTPKITCWIKTGDFIYRDRLQTGTNGEQVDGNCLTDIQGLIRIKF